MTWTTADILAWLDSLGSTRERQVGMVRHLMANANRDRMSKEDRVICAKALSLCEQGQGPAGERPMASSL